MSGKIGPLLAERLEGLAEDDRVEVHIFVAGEPARESTASEAVAEAGVAAAAAAHALEYVTPARDRASALGELRSRCARLQAGVRAYLDQAGAGPTEAVATEGTGAASAFTASEVRALRSHWINNSVTAEVSAAVLRSLAQREDVVQIELVRHDALEDLLDSTVSPAAKVPGPPPALPPGARTWSVERVNAPALWSRGLTGEGVVVAIIDTGVNYNHPDLRNRMWDGGPTIPHHGHNFFGKNDDPMDEHGHGTACAGIVAGDASSGLATGVAPGARVMALRVGTEEDVWDSLQFALDHGADVISMSLSWKFKQKPNYTQWRRKSEIILRAGVLHVNSAGNDGNDANSILPFNIGAPANCPPPWLHGHQQPPGGVASAVACGASDGQDGLMDRSGRGPAGWEEDPFADYPYQNATKPGLLKPDVCAPGAEIVSCNVRFAEAGEQPYSRAVDRTSAATPHVAGCVALLLQACTRSGNPVVPARIVEAIESAAVRMEGQSDVKENHFGAGRIDVLRAFEFGVNRGWWA